MLIVNVEILNFMHCLLYVVFLFSFLFPQLQTGLEANRILLQSVSPHLSTRQSKEKKSDSQVNTFTEGI